MTTTTTTETTILNELDSHECDTQTIEFPMFSQSPELQVKVVYEAWVTVTQAIADSANAKAKANANSTETKAKAEGTMLWKFPCECLMRIIIDPSRNQKAHIAMSKTNHPSIIISFDSTYIYCIMIKKSCWPFCTNYFFILQLPWGPIFTLKTSKMDANKLRHELESHVLKKESEVGEESVNWYRFLLATLSCQKQSSSPSKQDDVPFYLKDLKQWKIKDVMQWLDTCYLFECCTPEEKADDKYKCYKRSMRMSTRFRRYFEKNCQTGDDLLAFNTTNNVDLNGSANENSQVLAEVKAVQRATKFDPCRRVVHERLFMFSDKGATNSMELAEKLCSAPAIQEHYLNLDKMTGPVEVSLIVTPLKVSETTRVAAAMLPSRFLPANGLYHFALRVGDYIYDWISASVVNPRLYKDGSKGALIEFPIISAPLDPIKDKVQLQTLFTVLSNKIVVYNTQKMYNRWHTNCQTFINDVIVSLQNVTIHPAVEKYLLEMTQPCASYVQIKVDKAFVDRLRQLDVVTPNNVIEFDNHCELDSFLQSAAPKLRLLESQFPDNCYLIRIFYKAMVLRHCKNTVTILQSYFDMNKTD